MAISDASATAEGLSTLVGVDTTAVYDAQPLNITLNTDVVATRLGGATQLVEDPRYPAKAIRLLQTAGSVADGGVVAAGWLNRTGKTVAAGKYLFAVAA